VRQIQIRKTAKATDAATREARLELDLRTPAGRILPFLNRTEPRL